MTPEQIVELKKNIEELAISEAIPPINVITRIQSEIAMDVRFAELLDALCDLKWDYITC